MSKVELYKSNIIDTIIKETSPGEAEIIEKKMLIAAKIDDALIAKKWKKKDLMKAVGKTNPSEISKWLSGIHNFTIDTLFQLERVLDIRLLDLELKPKNQRIIYQIVVEQIAEVSGYHRYADLLGNTQKKPYQTLKAYSDNSIDLQSNISEA
jgi:transcriptional regulator with XRE-family HTH domain